MVRIFVNGQEREVSDNATANDIKAVSPGNRNPDYLQTRSVIVEGSNGESKRLRGNEYHQFRDGDRVRTVPNRRKAREMTFFGRKEAWRKAVIEDQVRDLSARFFRGGKVELDGDCNWVVFRGFLLPNIWQAVNPDRRFASIMLIFPDQYPNLPTNGFYLPQSLRIPPNAQHIFNRGYGGAFGETAEEMNALAGMGWYWYCTHILPGAWCPAPIRQVNDWRRGDNLWDIVNLIIELMNDPSDDED